MPKDLLILVADSNMKSALEGFLCRQKSLKTSLFSWEIITHPFRDPGCYLRSHDFLRPFSSTYRYSIVAFDRFGCGQEGQSREELEINVENRLTINGWENRSSVVVYDPELEIWIWNTSPQLANIIGWSKENISMYEWLREKRLLQNDSTIPDLPKEAFEAVLKEINQPRSSHLYKKITSTIGVGHFVDGSFIKFLNKLRTWFPEDVST